MYSVSKNYKNYIKTNLSLSSKCKIVVDNVTYTGSVIKTAPKILHNCDRSFGEFPTKKVNFEIYNLNNNLDFENKEIVVYKGLYIDNQIEWVPQGTFKPNSSNITTNISTRTITIQDAQDRTQLFDVPYVSTLSWNNNQTHSGQEIVDDICTQIGIELANSTFNWSSYQFKQPNFKEGITCREIIRRLAEIGNSIAFINREGKLEIKSRTATNELIERKRYINLSKENIVGPYNTLVLGKDGYNDDIVYPEVVEGDRIECKILDNPFVDLYREEMIETVASYFIGTSYMPFELSDFVDGFYFDLNDEIEMIDKNGNKFKSVILNYENTSRIKSKVGASTESISPTDYNLAGSQKQELKQVKLDVDHVNNQINSVVSSVKELDTQVNNNYQEIQEKFNGYTPASKTIEIENSVKKIQTDTYTKTEINTKLTDGSVTKVQTTSGTFDEDGMHYEKTGAKTSSTINEKGVSVETTQNNDELLFAGYDEELKESIVRTENLTVRKYFVCGSNSRFEDYTDEEGNDGTGVFDI